MEGQGFWEFSPHGIPFRKKGHLLIRLFTFNRTKSPVNKWEYLMISKFERGNILRDERGKKIFIENISESRILPLKKGINLSWKGWDKWFLTKEEKKLIKEVDKWFERFSEKKIESIHRKEI